MDNFIYRQYIPCRIEDPTQTNFNGVCLNHLLILKEVDKIDDPLITDLGKYYFLLKRETETETESKTYLICISREFGFSIQKEMLDTYNSLINAGCIYRDQYIFMPEFHKLVELGSERGREPEDLKWYTITQEDALCVIPELSFGKHIAQSEWEFINASKPFQPHIKPNRSVKEPFILHDKPSLLEPGYYNIIFRYRLTNEDKINTVTLNSAFVVK